MELLKKIQDDIENDYITSDYPFLKDKFKKIYFKEDAYLDFQVYFGYNMYNIDLSNCYLIDNYKHKRPLNSYLFDDDIIKIKIYKNTIIIYDKNEEKTIFKKQHFIYNWLYSLCKKYPKIYYKC
jgi:hypothetical protein